MMMRARPASAGRSRSVISTGPRTCTAIVSSWPWGDSDRSGGIRPALCTIAWIGPRGQICRCAAYVVEVGEVGQHRLDLRTVVRGSKIGTDTSGLLLVARDQHEAGAEGEHSVCRGQAQAGGGSRDDDGPPPQGVRRRVGRPGGEVATYGRTDRG